MAKQQAHLSCQPLPHSSSITKGTDWINFAVYPDITKTNDSSEAGFKTSEVYTVCLLLLHPSNSDQLTRSAEERQAVRARLHQHGGDDDTAAPVPAGCGRQALGTAAFCTLLPLHQHPFCSPRTAASAKVTKTKLLQINSFRQFMYKALNINSKAF